MNALNLYITTCRRILQPSADDNLVEIDRTFSYLRQSLSCCVCGNLLTVPMTSTTSQCQHSVCKGCVGGKMKIKPSCSWCKDYSQYGENVHIRIMLQLYKKLCQYCVSVGLQRKFNDVNGSTNTNFADLVQEGAAIEDDYSYKEKTSTTNLCSSPKDGAIVPPPPHTMNGEAKEIANGVYSVTVSEDNSSKIMIKRTAIEDVDAVQENETQPKRLRTTNSIVRGSRLKIKKKGCRCGMATPNPGKLTCCGQRCPCYVENKACGDCRCRGCRNPNKPADVLEDVPSVKKDISTNRRESRSNEDTSEVDADE